MAGAWAQSWGSSWGNSWGFLAAKKEAAGGAFRIRRSVTTPVVRTTHWFGWSVEFPTLGLRGLSGSQVFAPTTPPVQAAPARIEVPVAQPVARAETKSLYGSIRSFFAVELPSCASNAPFVTLTQVSATPPMVTAGNKQSMQGAASVGCVVSENINCALLLSGMTKKPKVVKNPTEMELIALLRGLRR